MAVKYIYRNKLPLLATGALCILQPLLSSSIAVAQQFDCKVGANGSWECSAQDSQAALPPRPDSTSAISSVKPATGKSQNAGRSAKTAAPAQPVSVSNSGGKALAQRSEDFSHLDWVPREQLNAEQLAEVGPYCSGSYIEPLRPGMDDTTAFKNSPLYINAGATRYEQTTETSTLAGDVVIRQASLQIEADEANLYQQDNIGELRGNVRLRDRNALMVGDRAELELDSGAAKVENAEYVMHSGNRRGAAQYVKRQEDSIIRLKDGTYTSCEPGSNAWHLRGNNITLNPETGFGSATNVTLRVKDIPVFYTPYIHFPIDDRRQSGFLPPSISYSNRKGVDLTTPYYFNLAPNFDATLYPNYMSKRGLLTEGELRHLGKSSESRIGGAWLSDSEDERKLQSEYNKDRWMYTLQHEQGFNSRLLASLDYTELSDPYYFQDLRSNIISGSDETLDQKANLSWRGNSYVASFGMHAYEMANISDITPYDRLPQFSLAGALPYQPAGLKMSYTTEWTRFDRSLRKGNYRDKDGLLTPWNDTRLKGLDRANGDRVHIEPAISLPMSWSWGFVKPTVKYAYTRYDLSLDSTGKASLPTAQKYNGSPDRSVAVYSVDSGLYFDRDSQWFGKSYRQTLEPRLFYLYVPNEDQADLPLFDTSEIQFSYASLFRDNRFSGRDRIGDANQLSLGLTNRWLESNGFERQRISVGQAYYFSDRKVLLSGKDYKDYAENTSTRSPYALDYMYQFTRDWRINTDLMWDPDTHRTRSGSAMFHYQPEDNLNKIVNFGYRYRNDSNHYNYNTGRWETGSSDYTDRVTGKVYKDFYKIEQTDASFMWPVLPQWSVIGRWQYDYNRNSTLEAFGGFEYDSCCWKLRLINRYWVDYDERNMRPQDNRRGDHGVFLQIVLKGLGGVTGNKVETFLDEGIQGYRERENNAY